VPLYCRSQEPDVVLGGGFGLVVLVVGLGLGAAVVVVGLGFGAELVVVLDRLVVCDEVLDLLALLVVEALLPDPVLTRCVLLEPAGVLEVDGSAADWPAAWPGAWPRARSADAALLAACCLCVSCAASAVATPVAAIAPAVRPPVITETMRTVRSRSRGVIRFMWISVPGPT
jgi:hypothetical protein